MKNIIEKIWKGDFLVDHKRKETLKDVEFKDGEPFKIRLIRKVKSESGVGLVELLFFIILVMAFVCLMISWHNEEIEQVSEVHPEHSTATAGIVYYMSRLEYYSMQFTEPIEIEEPEIETVAEPVKQKSIDDEVEYGLYNLTDHELLARIIYCECGNLGEEAMYATGSVVLNRVKDPRFEDTIKGVIFQTGQYAPTWDGNWEKYSEPSDVAWEIAEELLVYGTTIPENVVFQAQFAQGRGVYKQIGNQYFCY